MSEIDPHIHVDERAAQAGADVRSVIASTLGRVQRLGWTPGMNITGDQVAKAAEWHRDLARRFSG